MKPLLLGSLLFTLFAFSTSTCVKCGLNCNGNSTWCQEDQSPNSCGYCAFVYNYLTNQQSWSCVPWAPAHPDPVNPLCSLCRASCASNSTCATSTDGCRICKCSPGGFGVPPGCFCSPF